MNETVQRVIDAWSSPPGVQTVTFGFDLGDFGWGDTEIDLNITHLVIDEWPELANALDDLEKCDFGASGYDYYEKHYGKETS